MVVFNPIWDDIIRFVEDKTGTQYTYTDLTWDVTKKEYEGDFTLVVFPMTRIFKKKPDEIAREIGEFLVDKNRFIRNFNVIGGFLNLSLDTDFWAFALQQVLNTPSYGNGETKGVKVMVEFASPNTNKPLHLGHIRNILLGWSVAKIFEKAGYEVIKTQIVNDRGIAVCKSMLAWQKFGKGITPASSGMKGDHLVGDFYVKFDRKLMEEYQTWQQTPEAATVYHELGKGLDLTDFFKQFKNDYFNLYSVLGKEARQMLLRWEQKELETIGLWKMMNQWVYDGFDVTYQRLGVSFDHIYYESDTFLKGKDIVDEGLLQSIFYKDPDGSVWVDLTDVKMDKKILLRSDGTALYITQDMGTAEIRFEDHQATKMVYVVGDEQDYHFKVLFEVMKRMKRPYSNDLFHLSYGMVDLPTGRMKSREGTVVDADDLMDEVFKVAKNAALERIGETQDSNIIPDEEINKIALSALKFFILKVNPQKRMVFNPEESLDMQGQTGPYIQNAFVRIQSIFRKVGDVQLTDQLTGHAAVTEYEKQLIGNILAYPGVVDQAAREYLPSHIANFAYELAKNLHKFYAEVRIIDEVDPAIKNFRLSLLQKVADILQECMGLLGIEMVDKM
jgi:arginyl-tRNA synthetase